MSHVFVYGTLLGRGDETAFVRGRRLEFRDYPNAAVCPREYDRIWGQVWEVDDATLAELDRIERVEDRLYRRVLVTAELGDSRRVRAWLYEMCDPQSILPRATPNSVTTVREQYRALDLPEWRIDEAVERARRGAE